MGQVGRELRVLLLLKNAQGIGIRIWAVHVVHLFIGLIDYSPLNCLVAGNTVLSVFKNIQRSKDY